MQPGSSVPSTRECSTRSMESGGREMGTLGTRTSLCYLTRKLHPLSLPTRRSGQSNQHLWVLWVVPEVRSLDVLAERMEPGSNAEQQGLGEGWAQEPSMATWTQGMQAEGGVIWASPRSVPVQTSAGSHGCREQPKAQALARSYSWDGVGSAV